MAVFTIVFSAGLTASVAVGEPNVSVRAKLTPKLQKLLKTEMMHIAVSTSKIPKQSQPETTASSNKKRRKSPMVSF